LSTSCKELRSVSTPGPKNGPKTRDEDTRAAQFGSVRTSDGTLLPPANPLIYAVRPASYRDLSAFGNVTYQFTDRLDVTAGLRYSSNEQHFTTDGGGFLVNAGAGLAPTVITRDTGRSSEDVITYMVSPRFRPTEDTMLYARVASGYRPGGPNPALDGIEPSFDADRLVNYELGAKADFLQRRASVDLALFYIDWTDIQLQLNTPTNIVYRANGGNAISKGVELSTTFIPVQGLRIGGNLAYTDARLQEDVPALQARDGDRVPSVPRWTASLTSSYSFPLAAVASGEVGFGYRYVGETEYPFESNPTSYALDAYSLLDAYAAATFERFNVRLFARNLLDERAYSSVLGGGGPGAVQLTLVQPRTIGVSVDVTF
jgi:outer membrane receptor protein involved in Fe transport